MAHILVKPEVVYLPSDVLDGSCRHSSKEETEKNERVDLAKTAICEPFSSSSLAEVLFFMELCSEGNKDSRQS